MEFLPLLALLLFFRRRLRGRGRRCLHLWWRRRRRVGCTGHAFLETADALAEPFHDFWDALSAKENQNNRKNDHPMKNTELTRSEEHTSELQSLTNLVCRLLLEKK